jgi:exonuclease V gamma subunit
MLTTRTKKLNVFKNLVEYPKQENEHNALADAQWNKKLYEFLNKIAE